MAFRLLLRAALATAVTLAAAPAARADVDLNLDGAPAVAVTGSDHGNTVWPGDGFTVRPRVSNSGSDVATGVGGALSGPPATAIAPATSAFPDIAFGTPEQSTSPFGVSLAAGHECGVPLPFTLGMTYSGGSRDLLFSVPTGSTAPPVAYNATDLPRVIPDGRGFAESRFTVQTPGRVKDLKVRIGRIAHPYTGDLRIVLKAPDGRTVTLHDPDLAEAGEDFVNTTFSDEAAMPVDAGAAPFTGTYRPAQPLSRLDGSPLNGTWTLSVADTAPDNAGTFESWGADVSRAVCSDGPLPGVEATPNPALPGQTVTLDASSSLDPGATITKYEFDLGDGAGWRDNGADPVLAHTFAAGGYDVRVRITDDFAGPGGPRSGVSAPIRLSVGAPPSAALSASPAAPATGDLVSFDASGSTAPTGGSLVSYEWDFDGDGTFEQTTTVPTTTFRYATSGSKDPHVRVTSDIGATDTAGLAAPLAVQNRPPTASFTAPSVIVAGMRATFTSTSTDPDDGVADWSWTVTPKAGAPAPTLTGEDTATLGVTFPAPGGSYDVTLRVRDAGGTPAPADAVQTVRATRLPTASFTAPAVVTPDTPVPFDGTGSSDPDGPIQAWAWDFDDNGTWDASGPTPTFGAGWPAAGAHTVRLRVTDADGATATAARTVTVRNDPPTAALTAAPNPVVAGTPVRLSAEASSDPDGTVAGYEWDLDGDGAYESAKPAWFVTTFASPGTRSLGVRVRDDHGATATKRLTLVVSAPPSSGSNGGGSGSTSTGGGTGGGGVLKPPPAPGGSTGGTGGTTAPAFVARLSGSVLQRLRTVRRRGLAVSCRATRAGRCVVVATLAARDARRLGLRMRGRRPVTIGRAVVRLDAGRPAVARVRLNAAGRRAARSRRLTRVRIRLAAVVTDAAGRRATATRALLVRR